MVSLHLYHNTIYETHHGFPSLLHLFLQDPVDPRNFESKTHQKMEKSPKKHPSKKDKHTLQIEQFHAQSPVFSKAPIPEEFRFPLFDLYVKPLKYELAPDPGYILERLVPHFEEVVNSLTPVINQLLFSVKDLEEKIKKTAETPPPKYKYNFFNASLWRKFNVLYNVYNETKSNLLASRFSIQSKRAELLSQINNLAYYLAEHPRYYYINHVHAQQTWRSIEFDYISSVYIQFKAVKFALKDIEQQLRFIPHPFSNEEENKNFLRVLITEEACTISDPITGFIPYCECYEIFSLFIESRRSPIKFSKTLKPKNEKFIKFLTYMLDKLIAFTGFEMKSKEYRVLSSMCIRYLIDFYLFLENETPDCSKVDKKLHEFVDMSIGDIISPFKIFDEETLQQKAFDFFTTNQLISSVVSDIRQIVFYTNPYDIANQIHRVSLSLNFLLTRALHQSVEQVNASEEMKRMWGALLVAADMPGLCAAFKQVEQWTKYIPISKEFVTSLTIPLTFINSKL